MMTITAILDKEIDKAFNCYNRAQNLLARNSLNDSRYIKAHRLVSYFDGQMNAYTKLRWMDANK